MLHYRTIVPPLAAMLAVVLFARLGIWQMRRADEAKAFQSAIAAQAQVPPMRLDAAALGDDPGKLHWRAVEASGSWDNAHEILLDNQVADGVAGYFVYTPLRLPVCGCAVLVNRGWIAAGPDRATPPFVPAAAARPTIRGIAAPAPASGFGMQPGAAERLGGGLVRVQKLDGAELSAWAGVRIVALTVLLAPDEPDGFRRRWRPPDARADRHIAYALQWFLFALIAAGIAIRLNSRRR